MYSSPNPTPGTPVADEEDLRSQRSSSPTPSLGNNSNIEMFDLADLTDNISVASFGEANGSGSNTSESSHISSNLRKLDTKGCIGLFERLPLSVKIILLVLFSAIGLATLSAFAIALSARMLQTTAKASNFISQGKLVANVLQTLQDERRAGRTMLQGNGTQVQIDYLKSIPLTESALSAMVDVLSKNQDMYGQALTDFVTRRADLDTIRARTTARQISVVDQLSAYQAVIRAAMILLHHSNAVLGYDYDTSTVGTYNELNEAMIVFMQTAGVIFRDPSSRNDMLPVMYKAMGERDVAERILLNSGSDEVVKVFREKVIDSDNRKQCYAYIDEIMSKPGNYSFVLTQFSPTCLGVSALLDTVGDKIFAGDLQDYTDNLSEQSIGIIIAVVAVVLFFSIFSLSNSVLFARSIIGPWQRLNALQETTIAKFVPKGFLSLMGWKSISQAELGKCQEKEVTVLVVRIANFSKLESMLKETPNQLFDFVNAFLAYVGPYIRNNSGYIDKFNSTFFVALFQKDKKAMKAALELQQSMANFNKMQTTFSVILRITLVNGKNIIGTIGENERMESMSISTMMRLALRLQKVAKRANAAILTTKDTLGKLPNPKIIHHRYIGNIKLRSETLGSCELCEMLTFSDHVKIKTKDHFTKAVRCLQASRLQDALSVFESIVQANPSDTLALRYRDLTKQCIMENVKRLTEMTVSQMLQVPSLRGTLEQMCIQERSTENINLWNQIQAFKECQSAEERREIASRICNEFLQIEGKQAVNLSEEQVAAVKRVVQNPSTFLTPLLFVEIEAQIEHLMIDTAKRLKHQQQFKLEFLSSSLAYKLEEFDIL